MLAKCQLLTLVASRILPAFQAVFAISAKLTAGCISNFLTIASQISSSILAPALPVAAWASAPTTGLDLAIFPLAQCLRIRSGLI